MGLETIPMGILTGLSGSLIATPTTTAVAGGTQFVLPPGTYSLTAMGANIRFEVFDGNAWQTVIALGGISPLIYSDGTNYRFNNTGAPSQNAVYQRIG